MHFDFIEIGTSDFNTLPQTNNGKGISIEPIKYYLDRLPNKLNVIKVNAAVSDYVGTCKIYYVKPKDIEKYELPEWFRGCNSINAPHPTVKKQLGEKHDSIVSIDTVNVINFETIINDYNVSSIGILKIDTEGHDTVILMDYYKACLLLPTLLAQTIIFENNILSDANSVENVISLFNSLGYEGKQVGYDYVLTTKL